MSTMEGKPRVAVMSIGEPPAALIRELEKRGILVMAREIADAEELVEAEKPHLIALAGIRGAMELSTILEDQDRSVSPRVAVIAARRDLSRLWGLNRDVVVSLLATEMGDKVVAGRLDALARQAAKKRGDMLDPVIEPPPSIGPRPGDGNSFAPQPIGAIQLVKAGERIGAPSIEIIDVDMPGSLSFPTSSQEAPLPPSVIPELDGGLLESERPPAEPSPGAGSPAAAPPPSLAAPAPPASMGSPAISTATPTTARGESRAPRPETKTSRVPTESLAGPSKAAPAPAATVNALEDAGDPPATPRSLSIDQPLTSNGPEAPTPAVAAGPALVVSPQPILEAITAALSEEVPVSGPSVPTLPAPGTPSSVAEPTATGSSFADAPAKAGASDTFVDSEMSDSELTSVAPESLAPDGGDGSLLLESVPPDSQEVTVITSVPQDVTSDALATAPGLAMSDLAALVGQPPSEEDRPSSDGRLTFDDATKRVDAAELSDMLPPGEAPRQTGTLGAVSANPLPSVGSPGSLGVPAERKRSALPWILAALAAAGGAAAFWGIRPQSSPVRAEERAPASVAAPEASPASPPAPQPATPEPQAEPAPEAKTEPDAIVPPPEAAGTPPNAPSPDAAAAPGAADPAAADEPAGEAAAKVDAAAPAAEAVDGNRPAVPVATAAMREAYRVDEKAAPTCQALVPTPVAPVRDAIAEAGVPWQEARKAIVMGDIALANSKMCVAAMLNPASPAVEGLALLYITQEAPTEALRWLDKADAVRPGVRENLDLRAVALSQLGRIDEALEVWLKALHLDPKDTERRFGTAREDTLLAKQFLKRGDLPRAERLLRRATLLDPTSYAALGSLAELFLKKQAWPKARTMAEAALAVQEFYPEMHAVVAESAWATGDKSQAVASLERALTMRPDFFAAKKRLAQMKAAN